MSITEIRRSDAEPEKCDPKERHYRIPSGVEGLQLFLRHLPPTERAADRRVVVYVHGGTFPSALSIAHRFDGRSWRDTLSAAGFDVWALDFLGFGESDRYREMDEPAERHAPLGSVEPATLQLERAVRWIRAHVNVPRVSIIAHSWGTIVAGRFAGLYPDMVDRMVFFGPIAGRSPTGDTTEFLGWRLVSIEDQWRRFTAEVPPGEAPVLARRHFDDWAPLYLDTDVDSRTRTPEAVKVPSGPWQDIADAWSGRLGYDPGLIRAPVAIVRGAWDGMATDADARWLFDALRASPGRRDVKIARGTHLMHLEETRYALYAEAKTFLLGDDRPPL